MIVIRALSLDDAIKHQKALRELMRQLSPAREFRIADALATIEHKLSVVFGVFDNEMLIGTVVGTIKQHLSGRELYVDDVVVFEGYRSAGIGTKLEQHLVDFGRQERCEALQLTSSRRDAKRFYRRRGYTSNTTAFKKPI